MCSRHKVGAFSLIEAILAAFLLLTAVAMTVYVFDSSLQAEASNEQRTLAALVAETAMAQIRNDADRNFNQLKTLYDGQNWTLPEYPNFPISSKVEDTEIAVPCTELEQQYSRSAVFPAPEGRYLGNSVLKAEISVSWEDSGSKSVVITENVVNFSPATNFDVQLLLADGSVPTDTTVVEVAPAALEDFSVRATANGNPLNDIQFTWFVQPLTGFGSLHTVSRDGSQCIYQNAYRNFKNTLKFSPGDCFLVVRATYQGSEAKTRVRIKNG